MEKNKRAKKRRTNYTNQKNNANKTDSGKDGRAQKFRYIARENIERDREKQTAIRELKKREVICPLCGQPITDVAGSMADKATGLPVHFDCVMKQISETETLGVNEKISYIGQGRFAVLYFENPRDQRHFTIKKVIEWEARDFKCDWRGELSGLYSQVE
ncbi:MAG: hypothetical protein ACTTKL_02945 [Treponema sp.]